jgi:hypothetical protein
MRMSGSEEGVESVAVEVGAEGKGDGEEGEEEGKEAEVKGGRDAPCRRMRFAPSSFRESCSCWRRDVAISVLLSERRKVQRAASRAQLGRQQKSDESSPW